jgi:hypothetical protein
VAAPTPEPSLPARETREPVLYADARHPAVISAGNGVAFRVGVNLYATSESLTNGYGRIFRVEFPGALWSGTVVVHDRAGSGIALFSSDDTDYLPSVPPMELASAANLQPGARVRALRPKVETFITGTARATLGSFVGMRVDQKLVLLDVDLRSSPMLPGAPLLDDGGRVVSLVVRRREQDTDLFVAADHIAELVRRVPPR